MKLRMLGWPDPERVLDWLEARKRTNYQTDVVDVLTERNNRD